ncbi:MAG: hydantoinase/oxoprolinase family protein [Acetobacteraceae bacterium]|nr:hydantoinase/oxoprolinase family protein [Acetobacteraceae bacterium]
MIWLGIDVGGTFTDLVLYDTRSAALRVIKTPSTPVDQSEGILAGIAQLGLDAAQISRLSHGSTVATNTALERSGARLAAVMTAGHRDILIVGRGERTEMYDIRARPLVPLLERRLCLEIDERMLADGTVLRPLDTTAIEPLADMMAAQGVEAIAVCFINSYANPAHEQHVAAVLRTALPGCVVCASSDVLPEYREHARFFTTALNAYVAPRMQHYLGGLRRRLQAAGHDGAVSIMTSNGGTLPAEQVESLPALSMLSGPAAGVIAAAHLGGLAGYRDLITYDMGGTSTDVCVIRDGGWGMTNAGRVGRFPLALRQIDINSVGAGGGSIAAADPGGTGISVGPRSAGARPGPACYGHGGTEPTVTDANVVLGRLGTDQKLGGQISLDRNLAHAAVARLAERFGLDALAMAEGILRIAAAGMVSAIKEISVMRGLDPRDFALLAYGGAGPLHAALVAEELRMATVLVPPMPGNFSAFGLLVADVRRDYVRTRMSATATTPVAALRAVLDGLAETAHTDLAAAGFAPDRRRLEVSLDMRYLGQAFELSVALPFDIADIATVERAFRAVYAARYGEAMDDPSEIVSYRLAAWGLTENPALPRPTEPSRSAAAARWAMREAVFGGTAISTTLLHRDAMPVGAVFDGPAIVEEPGASTVVPPAWRVQLDGQGMLVLHRS